MSLNCAYVLIAISRASLPFFKFLFLLHCAHVLCFFFCFRSQSTPQIMMATPVLVRGVFHVTVYSLIYYIATHHHLLLVLVCRFFLFYTRVNLFFSSSTLFFSFFCTVHIFFLLWSSSINIIYIYIDNRVVYFFFFLYFRIDSFHCYSLRSIEVEHEWCVPPPPFFQNEPLCVVLSFWFERTFFFASELAELHNGVPWWLLV